MALLSAKPYTRLPIVSVLFIIWFVITIQQVLTYDVIDKCQQSCDRLVNLEENVFDIACNETCKLNQCWIGCQSWTKAQSSCTQACNDSTTVNNWVLYCVLGCNHALSVYIDKIKSEVGTPLAPYLVADTLTNESLTIEWKRSSYDNITYLVQWRYEQLGGDWNYYMPDTPLNTSRVEIKGLKAYTEYRFRVEWIVFQEYGMTLFSHQSVDIHTLAYGVPSTAPTITSAVAVSATQISVSWEAPRFPNGPIISYALYISEYPNGTAVVKDLPNSHTSDAHLQMRHNKSLHYMFNGLKANQTYNISVLTRNNFGEGPKAQTNVTTLESNIYNIYDNESTTIPELILATDKVVLRRDPEFPIDGDVIFRISDYSKTADINGLAVHVQHKYLFVSDTSGTVRRISLKDDNNKQMRTIVRNRSQKPSHLSVDWLADNLYMIEENKISRCNLDGERMESVVTGFKTRPADMKVDPYNGYLYWLSISDVNIASLYRIDLALIANDVMAYNYGNLILQESSISTFAVDFINYRLYAPISREASIFSIAIDGNDRVNVRQNSQRNDILENIENLVVFRNRFFFTKTNEVFSEEYDKQNDKYHHSSTQIDANSLVSLCVLDYESQPYPIPLNPVKNVEAIFLDRFAKIVWEKPDLLGDKGQGAWQQWSYEVSIEETESRVTFFDKGLTLTYCEAFELNPDTEYNIRVRAYSRAGNGSWSQAFHGKTLHSIAKGSRFPFALWSTREGVLKSNIVGDRVEHLVHRMNMNGSTVNDITWYRDLVFFNGENNIYIYNLTSHASLTTMNNITGASSIAVDWMAPKFYWSSPQQRMISRSNLDGSQSEPLPIMTFAKEIAIDSIRGYIYWATGYSVEFCRLNGMERNKYFETNLFTGKHIMGLTLNLDKKLIFWILRSYESVVLYSAHLANREGDNANYVSQTIQVVGHLPETHLRGPLSYYSDRMFWLEEQQNHALISGENGEDFAVLKGLGLNDINTVAVVDPSLQPIPSEFTSISEVQVIPNDLKEEDIKLTGVWDNFTIFWKKCENVNYNQVFYELVIEDNYQSSRQSLITQKTKYPYPMVTHLPPYSKIKLAIRAFTYWASSKQTVIELYSPMSTPSKPSKPRIFINYERSTYDNSIEKIHAEFRWSPPEQPNGVILGYTVYAWSIQSGHKNIEVENAKVYGQTNQIYLSDLKLNTTYYCQVQAFTEAGDGPPSDVIGAHSSDEHPVPRLLVTKTDSIRMADIDSHEENILTTKAIVPISVTYISKENLMFWVEEDGIIKKSYLDGSNITIIYQMPTRGSTLTIDWISRHLYWSESDNSPKSTIWSYDLNDPNARPVLITSKNNVDIGTLEVDPFTSTLIWTEMLSESQGQLKMCSTKNFATPSLATNVRLFFQQNKPRTKRDVMTDSCNCAAHPVIGKALTIDRSNYGKSELLWYDLKYHRIMASDMTGCRCRVVLNSTYGFPPTSLTVDNDYIYWSNSTLGNIYKVAKKDSKFNSQSSTAATTPMKALPTNMLNILQTSNEPLLVISEIANGVHDIKALSDHLQPYPHFECLVPIEYHETVRLLDFTAHSLTISMQEVRRPLGCSRISLASVKYTIFYGKVLPDGHYECGLSLRGCKTIETYNNTVTITGLEPFTNYTIRVAVRNYYTNNNTISLPGPPVNFGTAESRPSPPRNVVAKVETPLKIVVAWEPPEKPNGHPIIYEMRWYSSKDHDLRKAMYTKRPNMTRYGYNDRFIMRLTEGIKPGLDYHITIRAYSSDGLFYSDSNEVTAQTYKLPNDVYLVEKGSRFLIVCWESSYSDTNISEIGEHSLQYTSVDENGLTPWIGGKLVNKTQPSTKYVFTITNLLPNTEYAFRMLLTYRSTTALFIWPENDRFSFRTLGDAPEIPDRPKVEDIPDVRQPLYKVSWNRINGNGAQSLWYNLWYKIQDNDINTDSTDSHNSNSNWIIAFNGTENYWYVDSTRLSTDRDVVFKVAAFSEFGGSNFSDLSQPLRLTIDVPEEDVASMLVAILGAVFFVIIVLMILCTVRRRQVQEQKKKSFGDNIIHRNNMELVPWPELPGHPHLTNTLYINSNLESDPELMAIKRIARDQISETNLLGSGNFGEVFEGKWLEIVNNESLVTKVAIKTLRKGATDNDKTNFLEEAKRMAGFKHPHIIQLYGICLDANLISLVLELMEGGDLQKYLRDNRPMNGIPSSLTMQDLVNICTDVAKGCKYLEERHFIHRDLAARNCLISSFDPKTRVVKIGDFGLARDIYKNDYYRPDGKSALPVRWMSPESLIDGVFTSQSDVWSFGVLLYEVLSLGEQPYQIKSHIQVLEYVRCGGILEQPINCPDEIYRLMKRCWIYDPEDRPNFFDCLEELENIMKNISGYKTVLTAVHNQNYLFNRHSLQMMKNSRSSSAQSCSSSSTLRNSVYQNGHIKYEELVTNDECAFTDADGYQIPISKSPLQATASVDDKSKLLKTVNQIVVLNGNDNNNSTRTRQQPTASVRRKQVTESTRSCSPPPTYSQLFKANEVTLNNDLNNYENGVNGLMVTTAGQVAAAAGNMRPISGHQSLNPSHDKTKNCLLVINDNKPESTLTNNQLSLHPSSLSSSPISCSTSTSSSCSPIIAGALLKSQPTLYMLSQPSRQITETKYCFNNSGVRKVAKSLATSSVETSEEDYDTDCDTETIAANDMFANMSSDNNNTNYNQNHRPSPPMVTTIINANTRSTIIPNAVNKSITGYTNPLINGKCNDQQNQSKYALITRLETNQTFPTNTTNHPFNYDDNSSWC
ncbi:proto-oncogene tyrosine-protein kinase ROS-like isoform X2 [Oppia nitens]|uniref:proto-oncogene tyrosine-protein kinase ROS-like isoform X2 n=1 Tax=Oppia nitens TaxID=1686743 RepID=UPI0023DBAADF|nr:proto-oncogene tyrosine-protein kinase ROS-like isoform X2 [Oppia nitens]